MHLYFIYLGYQVHLVRIGRCATGGVPPKMMTAGEDAPQPKRAIISSNGDDPAKTVINIRQD